jgi:hypothetical protein
MIIGGWKSFECEGISITSNYDKGSLSHIQTETLPFKFAGIEI